MKRVFANSLPRCSLWLGFGVVIVMTNWFGNSDFQIAGNMV